MTILFQDLDTEDDVPLQRLPVEEILTLQRDELEDKARRDKIREKVLHQNGFSTDIVEGDQY